MYTPQRLFGEVSSASDILNHEPFLERARLQREQEHDTSARLALGAYVVARLVDKLFATETEESAIDGFRWQLDAVRRHIQELPPDAPETTHLAGLVAAVPPQTRPGPDLWKGLTAYAYFLEQEGRLEESLEMLALAARTQGFNITPSDFLDYALRAGRLNRRLARWDLANVCYQEADRTALSLGDSERHLRARLGHAHVLRGRGNLPAARGEVEEVILAAGSSELQDVQSDAHQDRGVILTLQGLHCEALEATYTAFRLSQDPRKQMRILGDLGYAFSESGYYEAARVALEIVAVSNVSHLVKLNALLELMQLESCVGNRVAFERRRHEANSFVNQMTPSMTLDYHYKTAVGLARFGQVERARQGLEQALAAAERYHLNEWYFRIEGTLKTLNADAHRAPDIMPRPEVAAPPAVHAMQAGLGEYASAGV